MGLFFIALALLSIPVNLLDYAFTRDTKDLWYVLGALAYLLYVWAKVAERQRMRRTLDELRINRENREKEEESEKNKNNN